MSLFSTTCYPQHIFCCRHSAVDVDIKPKDTDPVQGNPYQSYTKVSEKTRSVVSANDVTRSEPNLNGSKPEPVIINSVPSLQNLSENCLPENGSNAAHLKTNVHPKLFLQSKSLAVDSRPIFPNCPFSPYASPTNSPRSNRKRQPLKESRRVSIEKNGLYIQLNQYKLMDSIGQVSNGNY